MEEHTEFLVIFIESLFTHFILEFEKTHLPIELSERVHQVQWHHRPGQILIPPIGLFLYQLCVLDRK